MRGEAFSNSGHPDDDAKHGRLRNPTGHGGVYKIDGHGRPEPSVGAGELNFFPFPWGQEPPPTLHFLTRWGGQGPLPNQYRRRFLLRSEMR